MKANNHAAPSRPVVKYTGSKFSIASWIIDHFPPHENYNETYGGMAAVLLQKPRSRLETYNDLNSYVVEFLRILRERPDELIRQIRLTPWSREEYERCREPADDPLENARRFYITCAMGMGRSAFDPTTAPRFASDSRLYYSLTSIQITDANTKHLYTISKRLQGVQIENRDALEVIRYYDNDGALHYVDPPYVRETRPGGQGYRRFEMSDDDHVRLSEVLHAIEGFVVLSGYACDLYTELYEEAGWERRDMGSQANFGAKRVESIWLSPRTVEALREPRQMEMRMCYAATT